MPAENDATSISETVCEGAQPSAKEVEGDRTRKRDTSAKGILKLIERMQVQLFHTTKREAFARFWVTDHWENRRVKSAEFREWISAMCYHHAGFVPAQKALAEVTNTLAGRALFASPEEQVYVRLAEHNEAIYVDLANKSWEAVRITGEGWDIVPHVPIKFVRAPGMLALPRPTDGGRIEELRHHVNLGEEDHWKLAVSWLIAALQPTGPYPILILQGAHGSAKSTLSRLLLSLVDPNAAPLRGAPSNPRDLAISADNAWCLVYDNLSSVKPWLSDALCRLSTGGGFSTRALYTDGDEKIFEGMRPVLLNGIDIGIERADLLDRAIVLSLPPISEKSRDRQAKVWARFEALRPSILGGLFDGVACALRRLPKVNLSNMPRMADFATWVCAAEPELGWPEGSFLDAYRRNRRETNALALEGSSLVKPIMRIAERGPWEGTATELKAEVTRVQLEEIPADEMEPCLETPRELSQALHRVVPNLLEVGISVEFGKTPGNDSKRIIRIKKTLTDAPQAASEGSIKA